MTRGCRLNKVTKETLLNRLDSCNECRRLTAEERRDWLLPTILGHALYYGLLTTDEYLETVPRAETTIPCYIRPLLEDTAPSGTVEAIDQYAVVASKLYHRGSLISNYVAMQLYGPREHDNARRTAQRYDPAAAVHEARAYLAFVNPPDVRNSALKQVFLPERWPSRDVQRDPHIDNILEQKATVLPPLPSDWRDALSASGWDNALNRMATKLSGNIQVHCRANLAHRVGRWLGSTTSLRSEEALPVLEDALKHKLRPLAIHDDDWELLVSLRRTLGVSDEEPVYPPPKLSPYNDNVLALHMFVVRFGADESAYMPVARRGRKFSYLDAKIVDAMLSKFRKRTRKDDVKESESLGSLLGLNPASFNAKRTRLRQEILKKLKHPKESGKRPSDFKKRLLKKRRRLGSGQMSKNAIVQSMETDGVSARLCVKTPCDMTPFVVPLQDVRCLADNEQQQPKKKRRTRQEYAAEKAAEEMEKEAAKESIFSTRRHTQAPVQIALDKGRKKLWTAAVSTDPLKKPTSEAFTRSRYYSEMRYWRHRSWSESRAQQPHVAEALVEMSQAGGLRNCNPDTWDATLAAEREHTDVLDAEFVENPDYALWRMRMFRKKRASLDRATFGMLRRSLHDQPPNRGLVLGIGDGSFRSTGRGELSAPTNSLDKAFGRALQRIKDLHKHTHKPQRSIEVIPVQEYGTTMCCCGCGQLTVPPMVRTWDKRLGDWTTRRSRRLRLCTECNSTDGKRRDRDVQGARNILWILQLEYMGGDRPWYMTRKGRREMSWNASVSPPVGGLPTSAPVTTSVGCNATVTSSLP